MAEGTCGHAACTCAATEDDYCSEYCREHAGDEDPSLCECGHPGCAGAGDREAAV